MFNLHEKETFMMHFPRRIDTIDTHTEGEPTRIITNWIKDIPGKNTEEKMFYFKKNFDHVRKVLISEPRGHKDMYGCLLTQASQKDSDYGIIFMDNSGYQSMCGHGTIGVSTAIAELGMVKITEPITRIVLEPPAGKVEVSVRMRNGHAESVSFINVPAFIEKLDADLEVPGIGKIKVDIAFGGNYFVFYSAAELNIEVVPQNINQIIETSMRIIKAANEQFSVSHSTSMNNTHINIATILAKPRNPKANYLNVHTFSNRQFDRSPGGTATCARMAALHAKGQLKLDEEIWVESLTGGLFRGRILKEIKIGDKMAVVPEVTGSAFITGFHQFVIYPNDRLKNGFLF
jgi:proline racemase/trans-L-3-hydroxyproline dehydratase